MNRIITITSIIFTLAMSAMEREQVIDNYLKVRGPFYYWHLSSPWFEHIKKSVIYPIPDCMPLFCHNISAADGHREMGIGTPISCLFMDRKNVESEEPATVVINCKSYKLKVFKGNDSDDSFKELTFLERYKMFIDPVTFKIFYSEADKFKNDIIKYDAVNERYTHGPKGYPAFMQGLAERKKSLLLIKVIKETYKQKDSYLSLLPQEIFSLVYAFVTENDKNKEWEHLFPLLEYHEQAMKELKEEKKQNQ
jgi:hypothetical protein